jgi:hypothetical protein
MEQPRNPHQLKGYRELTTGDYGGKKPRTEKWFFYATLEQSGEVVSVEIEIDLYLMGFFLPKGSAEKLEAKGTAELAGLRDYLASKGMRILPLERLR